MSELKLKLVHLYPLFLNIYGDIGNIKVFENRCKWRGIELEIQQFNGDDELKEGTDIFFIGGGQDRQQVEVSFELQKYKNLLTDEYNNNAVFLGICGGYQLMGEYYQPHDAKRLEGIGILDAYTVAGSTRFIGNVSAQIDYIEGKNTFQWQKYLSETETTALIKRREHAQKMLLERICTVRCFLRTRILPTI